MSSLADDIRDAVQEELIPVASTLKPPDSDTGVKHAPVAALVAMVITQVLIPILTGFISTMLAEAAKDRDSNVTAQQLDQIEQRLKKLSDAHESDEAAIVDATIADITELPGSAYVLGPAAEERIAAKVLNELRRYHLSEPTSVRLAPRIVKRVVALFSHQSGNP